MRAVPFHGNPKEIGLLKSFCHKTRKFYDVAAKTERSNVSKTASAASL